MALTLGIGMAGLGTVGSGLAAILQRHGALLEERSGCRLELRRVCVRDPGRPRGVELPPALITTDLREVTEAPDIQIFVELMGGMEPARSAMAAALQAGKHVVTANKAVLAASGWELFRTAHERGLCLGFEASVAGGIPVIELLRNGLAANSVGSMVGILNGTSNYILSEMARGRGGFREVLARAQAEGYAEADPTYDIDGTDAAQKLTILASLAFQGPVELEGVSRKGIEAIETLDIEMAGELGYTLKLLAVARSREEGVELRVHPAMIPSSHLLARVDGVSNALFITGDSVGELLLYGPGAGGLPTGSAVAADLVAVARCIAGGARCSSTQFLGFDLSRAEPVAVCPRHRLESRFYIRFNAVDRPGVLAAISGVLGRIGISIESVVQRGRARRGASESVPIVMLTHSAPLPAVEQAVEEIEALEVVTGQSVVIPLEELG